MVKLSRIVVQKIGAEYCRFLRKSGFLISPMVNSFRYRLFQKKFRFSEKAARFAEGKNTFALYRIIGNALPPRHEPKQVLENLAFQLANESEFEGCTKYWIVNRIFDAEVRRSVIELLDSYDQTYFEIGFDKAAYREILIAEDTTLVSDLVSTLKELDVETTERAELAKLRLKRLYIMNNNGARNAAIEHGRSRAKWILPWDGNCFLTRLGWQQIVDSITQAQHLPYHIVPMARMSDNVDVDYEITKPDAKEEPQIIFHRDSTDIFDEAIPYGRRPKIEFLDRIGLWGPWKRWKNDPWDVGQNNKSDYVHAYHVSKGWVYRLSSGKPQLEVGKTSDRKRMLSRNEAIIAAVDHVDNLVAAKPDTKAL